MALTANRQVDHFVDQELRSFGVLTATHVYKGGFVGVTTAGYARPLVAGDKFVGLAYEEINNTGASGAKSVRVYTLGDFQHALTSAAVTDIGRAVYASADDTLTFDPGGNSFVGHVVGFVSSGIVVVRLVSASSVALMPIEHHAASFALTWLQSGSLHSNLGASGAIVATLPQSPPKGTTFRFACMADQEIRIAPGAAGGVYVKGVKNADNKYISVTDIGDFVNIVADGNGDWLAFSSINGADADITVES